jgi:hypothetical protein
LALSFSLSVDVVNFWLSHMLALSVVNCIIHVYPCPRYIFTNTVEGVPQFMIENITSNTNADSVACLIN